MKHLLLLLILILLPISAEAHKIRVFAYAEGDTIKGETSFNGGKPAKNIEILVTNSTSEETILTTRTNDQGEFTFTLSEAVKKAQNDILIIANAGEGHRNTWLLQAADYLPDVVTKTPMQQPQEKVQKTNKQPGNVTTGIDEKSLKKIVDQSVAEQLGPIKRMLIENNEKKVSLQDIIGGIGYIIGLAGLAAIMKSQKENAS
jgi:nickel transport protein